MQHDNSPHPNRRVSSLSDLARAAEQGLMESLRCPRCAKELLTFCSVSQFQAFIVRGFCVRIADFTRERRRLGGLNFSSEERRSPDIEVRDRRILEVSKFE